MVKTRLFAATFVGLLLWGCVPTKEWTYAPVVMKDGFATTIRHKGVDASVGPFGGIYTTSEGTAEIKLPDGVWIDCFGDCGATYILVKGNHPAPPTITPRSTNPQPVEAVEEREEGGGGGGGGGGD